ncbi:alpha-amlyase [Actinoplanes sp. SE50]|uniref:carbohydrate-binding module family 20 domain-containing protein n=1 Tax=unclassified Actinoplanes TaxID=2626549 RepID=UPI00023EC9F0|nr:MULTISPECIES: carbohydrate-binding module family 20 domain-containing protein [unclassified Actinoplanes]AEV86508.1 alpha-amylase [Actinoplanes sp. SE50/110]ATO84906.1 alpha-amlyase [Actinoplanes sp. SE50]SLM02315.1 alpha-amlyase [Actinoplanes sp. SE50/110]
MTKRLVLAAVTSLALAGAGVAGISLAGTASAAVSLNNSDVTANLWEWNFDSVAAACTSQLGPAGYGAVQVAPPQESVTLASTSDGAHPWWEVYQPVSYDVSGRLGTQAQFTSMVTTCHNAGVRVYVDAVINHMAGSNNTGGSGYGGSTFNATGYSYPAVPYSYNDFHHPNDGYCNDDDGQIDDYSNAAEVQNCELVSLSDLKSQDTGVRTKIAGYLNKLVDWGVDGFRVDAAKHMAAADLSAIKALLHNTTEGRSPYFAQEVIPGGSGAIAPSAYTGIGDVLGFSYAYGLKTQFANGTLSNLSGIPSWSLDATSDQTAAMVTNHDLERNGSTLRYQDGSTYLLANYFLLAYPYGQPFVYDGFAFSTSATGASPPADANGYVTSTSCTNGAWQCTTQSAGVKGMVAWHNATRSATTVSNWTNTASNVIGFSRGSLGWFGVNRSGSASTATYTTGLADGAYRDRIAGTTITVSGGRASVTIPANGAVAIDVNARSGSSASPSTSPSVSTSPTSSTGTVQATFNVYAATTAGTSVYVVGSTAALGNWDTAKAVALSAGGYPIWSSTVAVPSGSSFEYKYLKKDAAGNVTWESNANRAVTTGSSAVTFTNSFGVANAGATAVTFTESATGTGLYVVGSIASLGSWNTADAIPLTSTGASGWSRLVALPQRTTFQYKYLRKDSSGTVTWESGSNRSYTTGTASSYTISDTWK